MRHHNDSIILFQFQYKVLDLGGGDRIESGGRLVHEQHLRLRRERACNTDALLLATRHGQRGFLQAVLCLLPDRGAAQRALHDLVQLHAAFDAMRARAVGDVVVNGHGERVGFLEHHAHALTQKVHIAVVINVLPVQADIACDPAALDQIVHPVKRAEQRRFAAAGRADKRRDLIGLDVQVNIMQRMEIAVMQIHAAYFNFIFAHAILRLLLGQLFCYQRGQAVHQQHNHQQHDRGRIGLVHVQSLAR